MITKTVEILARPKTGPGDWKAMSIPVKDEDDAKQQIRNRSQVMDDALRFAVRVTTIEEYSERN